MRKHSAHILVFLTLLWGGMSAPNCYSQKLNPNDTVSKKAADKGRKKLCVKTTLEKRVPYSTEPVIAKVRITNCSDGSVPFPAMGAILVSITRYPSTSMNVSGEDYVSGFSLDNLRLTGEHKLIPTELAPGRFVEFEINLDEGIWEDSYSSIIDFNHRKKGLYWVPLPLTYLTAQLVLKRSLTGKKIEYIVEYEDTGGHSKQITQPGYAVH